MSDKLPAGTYYIGDPCYVMGKTDEMDWLTVLDKTNYFDGEIHEVGGYKVWGEGTAHGDGEYKDQEGNEYGVDSGTLAAVPLEYVHDVAEARRLGHIHEFDEDFDCERNGGVLRFGSVEIDTDPAYDDEEDY